MRRKVYEKEDMVTLRGIYVKRTSLGLGFITDFNFICFERNKRVFSGSRKRIFITKHLLLSDDEYKYVLLLQ